MTNYKRPEVGYALIVCIIIMVIGFAVYGKTHKTISDNTKDMTSIEKVIIKSKTTDDEHVWLYSNYEKLRNKMKTLPDTNKHYIDKIKVTKVIDDGTIASYSLIHNYNTAYDITDGILVTFDN